jgi:hypothetical protein
MATRTQWLAKCTLAGAVLVLLASCDRAPTEVDIPDGGGRPTPPAPSFAHGPHSDAFGYTAFRIPFTFNDISTTGTTVLDGLDDAAVPVPIGFTFSFYGVPHTTVFVSTNALLTFVAGNPAFTNMNFSGPVLPDLPSIAPLWDDWRTDCSELFPAVCPGDDRVVVQTIGQPGARQFIVQWHIVPHFPTSPSTVTFQAVLFEGTNFMEFRWLDTNTGQASTAFGASATVGIRDVAGHLNGRFIAWSFNQPVIPDMSAIRITLLPPSGKVTGGGQIDVPGGVGNFGFNAELENASGQASGHLNYLNHVSRVHLNCTVTNFTVLTPTMARFNGTCSSESYTGTFMAEVEDNGEPGKNVDKFTITYGATTDGAGTTIRSGNIQIHETAE